MRKLILAGLATAAITAGGVAMTQPAQAQVRCWSGPLGILGNCHYVGPYVGPYRDFGPYGGPYYAPPPPPAYYGYGPYWR